VLAGIGYWLIGGLDFSIFLGFVTGIGVVRAAGGSGDHLEQARRSTCSSSARWAAASGSPSGGSLVVSSADNWIKPIFIGGARSCPTSLLLIALLGGLQVYGFLGVFLGPVILALLLTFVAIYRDLYVARPLIQPACRWSRRRAGADRVGLTPQHRLGLRHDLAQHVAGGLDVLEAADALPGREAGSRRSACSRQ
jgi:hypothetical protein